MQRVAIVCGHFMPEAGYYEVHIAKSIANGKILVRVFTSTLSNLKLKHEIRYPKGLNFIKEKQIEILRFKPLFHLGSTLFSMGVAKEIIKYKPDLVIAIGIAKIFPTGIFLRKGNRNFLLYTFFGENSDYYTWHNTKAKIRNWIKYFTRALIKKPFYQLAIRKSDKIFLYTPETIDFLINLVSRSVAKTLKSKSVNTSLGFDGSIFYFDPAERSLTRNDEGIQSNEFVILTVTRYSKSKRIEFFIDNITKLRKLGILVKYWIIGFTDNDSLNVVNNYIKTIGSEQFISCYPFMEYNLLRKFQSAADIGLWSQVTISIQQCMGSGLPVILEEKKSVSHLVINGFNGFYYNKENIINTLVMAFNLFNSNSHSDYFKMRKSIEIKNHSMFAYKHLVKQIL